jgi:hypothetical protein
VTISTIVFLPQSKTILLAGGLPCRTRFQEIKEGAGG